MTHPQPQPQPQPQHESGEIYVYAVTDAAASPGPTPSQTVGPFFAIGLPYAAGSSVAGVARPGAFALTGRVLDGDGQPVPDALVEVWQCDEQGRFVDRPGIFDEPLPDAFRGFGRCATSLEGTFRFWTVKPGAVSTTDGRTQAPHLAMSIFARGMLRRAVTRVYFVDEAEANAADELLSRVEPDRVETMMATPHEGGYRFDVHLQGDDETVFLDGFDG